MSMIKVWIWRNLKAFDQGCNTLLYPILNPLFKTNLFGSEDELISSVLGKLIKKKNRLALFICNLLSRIDNRHCEKSIEIDESI